MYLFPVYQFWFSYVLNIKKKNKQTKNIQLLDEKKTSFELQWI